MQDCLYEKFLELTTINEGDEYNYTVTITNVIGSAVKYGSIGECIIQHLLTRYVHIYNINK